MDYAPASCTQQQTTIATVPSDANLTDLAWTPDDSGLLLVHSGQGSISYADRAADTVTTVISEPGRYFGSVAVDQHWNVFVTSIVDATPYPTGRIDAAWLGDPGSIAPMSGLAGFGNPRVSNAGPADPAPAGFPGGSGTPTPTATPTPTPTPTPLHLRR